MSGETSGQVRIAPEDSQEVVQFKKQFDEGAKKDQGQATGTFAKVWEAVSGLKPSSTFLFNLGKQALKLGQSALMPIPAEDLVYDSGKTGWTGKVGDNDVEVQDFEMTGAEMWLYNFATWEGPTVQIKALNIGLVTVTMKDMVVAGKISVTGIKLKGEVDLKTLVIQQFISGAQEAAQVEYEEMEAAAKGIKERATQAIKSVASASVEIGGLTVDVQILSHGKDGWAEGQGKVNVGPTKLGVEFGDGGSVSGGTELDLSGNATTMVDAVSCKLNVSAAGKIDVKSGLLQIAEIIVTASCRGKYQDVDTALEAFVVINFVEVSATTAKSGLLSVVRDAYAKGYADACQIACDIGTKLGMDHAEIVKAFPDLLSTRMVAALSGAFKATLKATLKGVRVQVTSFKYGDSTGGGSVSAEKLEVGVSLKDGQDYSSGKVTVGGQIDIDLGGVLTTAIDQLKVTANVGAQGLVDLRAARINVPTLTMQVDCAGTVGDKPATAKVTVEVKDVALHATTNRSSLVTGLAKVAAQALADAWDEVIDGAKEDIEGGALSKVPAAVMKIARDKLFEALTKSFNAEFSAKIGKLEVKLIDATYGDSQGQGELTVSDVELRAKNKITGGKVKSEVTGSGDVEIELASVVKTTYGKIAIEAIVAAKGKMNLEKTEIAVPQLSLWLTCDGLYEVIDPQTKAKSEVPLTIDGSVFITDIVLTAATKRKSLTSCLAAAAAKALQTTLTDTVDVMVQFGIGLDDIASEMGPYFISKLKPAVQDSLTTTLSAKLGKLSADITKLKFGDTGTHGKVEAEKLGVKVGVDTTGGDETDPVTVSGMGGEITLDLAGYGQAGTPEFPLEVYANKVKARLDARTGSLTVDELSMLVMGEGKAGLPPLPARMSTQIKLQGLVLQSISSKDGLLDCVAHGCAEAWSETVASLLPKNANKEQIEKADAAVGPTLQSLIMGRLATDLRTRLKMTCKSVSVTMKNTSFGDKKITDEKKIEGTDLEMGVGISPESMVDVNFSGDMVVDWFQKYNDQNFLDITGMAVDIDKDGTGQITGDVKVHSGGIKELQNSKLYGKLSTLFDKTADFEVPVKQFLIDFAAIKIGTGNVLLKMLKPLILKKVRVTLSGEDVVLKVPYMDPMTPTSLGQLPQGDPILIAKQAFASKKSRGAVNLQAYVQNMVQAQLNEVRKSLLG